MLRAYGIHCYAGAAAEYRGDPAHLPRWIDRNVAIGEDPAHNGGEPFSEIWWTSEQDRKGLSMFADRGSSSRPTTRWHGPSWRRARALLASRWDEVEAVADALLQRGTVRTKKIEATLLETTTK